MIDVTQQWEKKYTNQYMMENYFDKHWQPRVWLGPAPPGAEYAHLGTRSRWADVIVFEPHLITIVEFKLEPDPKAVGQLDLYEKLFDQTVRMQQYWGRGIKKLLVTTRVDDNLKELAEEHNIKYVVYRPDWVKSWEAVRKRL